MKESFSTWDSQIEKFLRIDAGFLDGSPRFSWQFVREFVAPARLIDGFAPNAVFSRNACRLLYHASMTRSNRGKKHGASQQDAQGIDKESLPDQEHEVRQVFRDFEYLKYDEPEGADRTTMYITDMSPVCLAALMMKANPDFVVVLREYFSCHLGGEVFFLALKPTAHHASSSNVWPRHVAVERKFTYAFHLPYVALRDRNNISPDPRGLRQWAPMIEAFDPLNDAYEFQGVKLGYFDASSSLLVVGKDESDWKAYCNVDTWFGGTLTIDEYLSKDLDGPSGDARLASDACTNAREFFLLCLTHRMRQISHEWGNVATALCQRLAVYEANYLQSIDDDKADLHDDRSMTRTRSYSKAAAMLRQFYDSISQTLDGFEAFMSQNSDLYEQQDDFEDRCGCYKTILSYQIQHLARLRKRFLERMQRFESMRDSLLAASMLRENRQFNRQSQDIELLTKVTVTYLPFSLAAAILGMSTVAPTRSVWLFWLLLAAGLVMMTFYPSFKGRLLGPSRNRSQSRFA